MLIFNGKAYAKTDKEFTESLFTPVCGHTCNGFYRRVNGGIRLMRQDKALEAFIVDRPHEKFIVSAGMRNGKAFYMFGLSDISAKWLGLNGSMRAEYDAISSIVEK